MVIVSAPFFIPFVVLNVKLLGSVYMVLVVDVIIPMFGLGFALGGGPYDLLAQLIEGRI